MMGTWRTQKTGNGKKGQKLIGVKKLWKVRELFEKYSSRPWDGMAPRLDLISFWQSGHVTSEVNFGLWPHVGGLVEYLSNSS